MNYLDLHNWNRKEHFHFFKKMDLPFFGLTATLECTHAFERSKADKTSFFVHYLHACLVAVNQVENMKYRMEGDKVRVENKINVAPTIGREDFTFGFSFMEFDPDFSVFHSRAVTEINRVRSMQGLCIGEGAEREDVIHFSSLPWINFSHLSHATMSGTAAGVPKISVGKLTFENGRAYFPVSVHLHHALADGIHAGLFFSHFEAALMQA